MFFRYVYGKIHQYPYLHVITWGLPRRYFGLLKIFNVQLEYQPHLFLKQYSDAFNEYELPSTSSVPPTTSTLIDPAPNTSKYNYVKKDENEEPEPELDQNCEGGNGSSKKRNRHPKRKPIISIKIKLDDDLRNLKTRSYSKNLDKILSKRSPKTHLLIIERSSSSRRDEYHLRIVNSNTINSHPYRKLLKKNREKQRKTSSMFPVSIDTSEAIERERISSSNFTSENIYPPLKKTHNEAVTTDTLNSLNNYSLEQGYNKTSINHTDKKINGINYFPGSIADQMANLNTETVFNSGTFSDILRKEAIESIKYDSSPNVTSNNSALSVPSQLIPYEEKISEEKPLRHWPIITQIFNKSNFEICKNYLKSFNAEETEHTEVKEESKVDEKNVKIDISPGVEYHNSTKLTTLFGMKTTTQTKMTSDFKEDAPKEPESEPKMDSGVSNLEKLTTSVSSSKSKSNSEPQIYVIDKINPLKSISGSGQNNSPSQLFTSTACLQIDSTGQDSPKDVISSTFYNDAWKISHPRYSLTDSLVNMRLLSSSTKSYESIVIPGSQEDDEGHDAVKEEEIVDINTEKKNEGLSKDEPKRIRKLYIIGIAIAILISFGLGIILFITISDSSKIVTNYLK